MTAPSAMPVAAPSAIPVAAPPPRIAELELLRAIAVIMIVVSHIPYNLLPWHSALGDITDTIWNGGAGLDLLFVVSGFVTARQLLPWLAACNDVSARAAASLTYVARRAWRVLPACWMWIVVPLALSMLFNASGAFHDPRANLSSGLAAVLAVNNLYFAEVFGNADAGITYPLWALSLGIQLTLLLLVLALTVRRRIAAAMLVLVAYQFVMPHTAFCISTRPGGFAIGVLLAQWSGLPSYGVGQPVFLRSNLAVRALFLGGLVLMLGALQSGLLRPLFAVPYGLSAIASAMLVYAASFDGGLLMRPGVMRTAFAWMGSRAYAIYLVHLPAFALTRELYFRLRPPILVVTTGLTLHILVVGLVLTAAASELTFQLVERPGRRYGRALRLGPAT